MEIEYGKCQICGQETPLKRTYFNYPFKCDCHSPNHFELVRHCADCKPEPPKSTVVFFDWSKKTSGSDSETELNNG